MRKLPSAPKPEDKPYIAEPVVPPTPLSNSEAAERQVGIDEYTKGKHSSSVVYNRISGPDWRLWRTL